MKSETNFPSHEVSAPSSRFAPFRSVLRFGSVLLVLISMAAAQVLDPTKYLDGAKATEMRLNARYGIVSDIAKTAVDKTCSKELPTGSICPVNLVNQNQTEMCLPLRNVVNGVNCGMDPSGTSNSTSAFNAAWAVAAAREAELKIPPGTYLLCGAAISAGYVHLHGDIAGYSGKPISNTAVLKPTVGCATYMVGASSPNLRNVEIDHIVFDGAGASPVGLFMDTTINWNVHDNEFESFPNGGIALKGGGGLYSTIERNGFSNQGRGIDLQNVYSSLHAKTYYGCNVCWIDKNTFSDGGERIGGFIDFFDNDVEQGPIVYPPSAGYQYWGAVDFSDTANGALDAHDNYFELSIGPSAINTTSNAAIATGLQTVTPASMTKIAMGVVLSVDGGSSQEFVQVASVTSGTFTATFARAHGPAPVTIASPLVAFNIEGSVCSACRIVGNMINGEKGHSGSTAINLAHQVGTSGYTYSVEMHGNQFNRWDIGAYIPASAAQPGISVQVGPNEFSLASVNHVYEGSGAYVTRSLDATSGNPARAAQNFSIMPQGIYVGGMAINFGIVDVMNNDTTLDLSRGNVISLRNTAATSIDAFYAPSPVPGEVFTIVSTNGNSSLTNSAFNLCTGADLKMPPNVPLAFIVDYGGAVRQVCPSAATPVIYISSRRMTQWASVVGQLQVMNCSGDCSITLPASPMAGWNAAIVSIGSTLATVSLNGFNYNGGSTAPVLNPYCPLHIWSDGTQFYGDAPLIAGSNIHFSPAANGMTVNATLPSMNALKQGSPYWLSYVGDGSEGAYICAKGSCQVSEEHWYSSIHISSGASLYNNLTTPLVLRATGTCTIAGAVSVSANSSLFSGLGGGTSLGGGGGGTASGSATSQAGSNGSPAVGLAGGGIGSVGPPVSIGLQHMFLSNGMGSIGIGVAGTNGFVFGGSEGGAGGTSGPAGGKGGGAIVFVCAAISFTGTIDASGMPGRNSTANNMGASGGGGGGVVILSAQTYTADSGTINVTGGSGGSCGAYTGCGAGRSGGNGWSYRGTIQ
jgi:hypothetical protein